MHQSSSDSTLFYWSE